MHALQEMLCISEHICWLTSNLLAHHTHTYV
jgi:hypothetical protein